MKGIMFNSEPSIGAEKLMKLPVFFKESGKKPVEI